MIFNPFEQFQVQSHFEFVYSNHIYFITNTIVICIFIIVLFQCIFLVLSFRKKKSTKNILLNGFKSLYDFMYNLINSYLPHEGRIYFPFFFIYLCLFVQII